MLTSLNRLTGLPVVWKDQQMGYVERAVADVRRMRLCGLVVRKGIGSARWSPAESIELAGKRSVVLNSRPVRMTEKEPLPVNMAMLASGGCAGTVCDVYLHGDTMKIAALEIAQNPLMQLLGRCFYAADCSVHEDGQAVVPQLLSWTQLLTQLGEEDGL